MTHKVQSWNSVPLETMSDLIPFKVVTGETFREFRENPKNRSTCPDRCFKHLQMAFGMHRICFVAKELQVGNIISSHEWRG
jgi:hypothetical protein